MKPTEKAAGFKRAAAEQSESDREGSEEGEEQQPAKRANV